MLHATYLKVRQKLGTRNVLQNLQNLQNLHSLTLDMLNNFCLHVYVQKSLFIAENCNVFSWEPALWTLNSQERVMWWWMSKKTIAIFGNKKLLLSTDMKTKVVEHVESEWMQVLKILQHFWDPQCITAHDVPWSGIHMRPQVAARDQTRNIFVKSWGNMARIFYFYH